MKLYPGRTPQNYASYGNEISLGYLQGWQTVLEQYIDGTAAVNQHSIELNLVDTRIED